MQNAYVSPGATGVFVEAEIFDTTGTFPVYKTGLTHSNVTTYYKINTAATWTAVTQITGTIGTWTDTAGSYGFTESDATHAAGRYQVDLPNAAIPPVNGWVDVSIYGTNILCFGLRIHAGMPVQYGMNSGVAQTGTTNTITLVSTANANDRYYEGALVQITAGTGAGQTRIITKYNGTTKVATVTRNWVTAPDNTSVYTIIPNDLFELIANAAGPFTMTWPSGAGTGTLTLLDRSGSNTVHVFTMTVDSSGRITAKVVTS